MHLENMVSSSSHLLLYMYITSNITDKYHFFLKKHTFQVALLPISQEGFFHWCYSLCSCSSLNFKLYGCSCKTGLSVVSFQLSA